VLGLIVAGQPNKEIARRLRLGEGTVKIHVAALLRALKVSNRSAAAAFGARMAQAAEASAARSAVDA
jgi:DNA-binding NarL/FixJ family response regulator